MPEMSEADNWSSGQKMSWTDLLDSSFHDYYYHCLKSRPLLCSMLFFSLFAFNNYSEFLIENFLMLIRFIYVSRYCRLFIMSFCIYVALFGFIWLLLVFRY